MTDAKDLFRYFLKEQERNLHEEKYVEEETSRKSEEFEEQKEESAILGKVLLKICFFVNMNSFLVKKSNFFVIYK